MNGIYKRKKTDNFAQIENEGLQTLEDIRSIGGLGFLGFDLAVAIKLNCPPIPLATPHYYEVLLKI
jgi:hypothetical protein